MADLSFNEKMKAFEAQLTELQNQCSEAEKSCIVAETNLKSLGERQAQLVKECEDLAGCSIEEVPDFLREEETAIQDIMSRLSNIDVHGEITPETLTAIGAIVQDFNMV